MDKKTSNTDKSRMHETQPFDPPVFSMRPSVPLPRHTPFFTHSVALPPPPMTFCNSLAEELDGQADTINDVHNFMSNEHPYEQYDDDITSSSSGYLRPHSSMSGASSSSSCYSPYTASHSHPSDEEDDDFSVHTRAIARQAAMDGGGVEGEDSAMEGLSTKEKRITRHSLDDVPFLSSCSNGTTDTLVQQICHLLPAVHGNNVYTCRGRDDVNGTSYTGRDLVISLGVNGVGAKVYLCVGGQFDVDGSATL